MRYIFSFLLLLFLQTSVSAQGQIILQDKPFSYNAPVDTNLWATLQTAPNFLTLSTEQKWMFYWTNLFRRNPQWFFGTIVRSFLDQFPEANTAEAVSLEADIQQASPLPFLFPDNGLTKMAQLHAKDMASRNGIITHTSSSGKQFAQRLREAGRYPCGAENVFSGSQAALEALIILLLDHGVADKGHRINLLDPTYTIMGAATSIIKSGRHVWVQEFGCR